jgi:hypothetical protein
MKHEITQDFAKECFNYCPATGEIVWKVRPAHHFAQARRMRAFNTRCAGKIAGTADPTTGYLRISIGQIKVYAHQVAFLYQTGQIPKTIDHKDGNKRNNKWSNLRECDTSKNLKNCFLYASNTTGFVGVYKKRNKWKSSLQSCGKYYSLGVFEKIEDAVAARNAASEKHGFTGRHGQTKGKQAA